MNPLDQKRNTVLFILLILCFATSVSAQVVPVLKYVSTMEGTNVSSEDFTMDAAGNTYTIGWMWGTVDFDPSPGTYNLSSVGGFDAFVSKMDPAGNLVWARIFGGSEYEHGYGIAVDASGNVYTTGRHVGTTDFDPGPGTYNINGGASYSNAFISKLNSNGDFVWAVSIGSSTEDLGESIAVDASGNVHVTGTFSNTVDFDPGTGSFNMGGNFAATFILKLTTNGSFIWAKTFPTTYQTYPRAITIDGSGNVYTTGSWYADPMDFDPGAGTYFLTPVASSTEMFISKLDINGNFVWAKSIGNQYTEDSEDIELDNSGNILLTGKYVGTVDFDPGAGVSNMSAAEGTGDIFILKLANDGTYLWSKTMGGVGIMSFFGNDNHGFAITSDLTGNVFVTGRFSSAGDFDPGPGVVTLNAGSNSYTDLFISKFDATGNLIWTTDHGSSGYDFGKGIRTDAAGAVYIGGQSVGAVDFDPSACVFNAGSSSFAAFVLKLGEAPPIPAPTITSFTPTFGPVGTPVTITGTNFSAVAAENAVTFFNNKPAVVTGSTLTTINTSVPVSSTTGVIKVTVACVTVTSTAVFTVGAAPVITINPQPVAATVCIGATAIFTTAASGTTNLTYQWQYSTTVAGTYNNITNSGGYSNTTTPTLSVNTTGSFGAGYYRCKVDGDFALTKYTNNVLLTVSDPATPTVTNGSRCGPGTVTLTAAGGSAGQYRWYTVDTGGTAIAGATNATYSPSVTTTTPFYVSIRIGTCESPRVIITGTVNTIPGKPAISSSITPNGNNVTFCSSNILTLSAPSGFTSYLWSNGAVTQQINISIAGAYSVRVTNAGCTSISSDAINVSIQSAPCGNQSPVIAETTTSTTIGGAVSLSIGSLISDADNNIDLQSLKIKSPPISGAPASIVNTILNVDYSGIPFSGKDRIAIEVCDLMGSCSQSEINIDVIGDLVIYNGVSPNNDGLNDFLFIQHVDALEETKNNKVSIYNRWGDKVFSVDNYNNTERVFSGLSNNGNELSSGTYFYKIDFTSGKASQTGYLTLKK